MKISFVHNNIKFNKAFPGILIYFGRILFLMIILFNVSIFNRIVKYVRSEYDRMQAKS